MPTLKERLERKVQDYLSSDQVSKREQEAQEEKEKTAKAIKEAIERHWRDVEEKFDKLSPEELISGSAVSIELLGWYHLGEIMDGLKKKANQEGIELFDSHYNSYDGLEVLWFRVSKQHPQKKQKM